VNITFINCGGTPNSYSALFPNNAERSPYSGYSGPLEYNVCGPGPSVLLANPSGRVMPVDYYTFLESQFGGCGPCVQTDGMVPGCISAAIGFR